MLVYFAAPYSSIVDKDSYMNAIMKCIGEYMLAHPGEHVVTPLVNHFALPHVPLLGTDWNFWKEFSLELISKCSKVVVLVVPGVTSAGVTAEVAKATEWNIPIEYITYE